MKRIYIFIDINHFIVVSHYYIGSYDKRSQILLDVGVKIFTFTVYRNYSFFYNTPLNERENCLQ